MLGIQILVHSAKLVIFHWRQAILISIPALVPWVLGLCFLWSIGPLHDPFMATTIGSTFIFVVAIGLVWTAVGWHRFVLKSEVPVGLLPEFHLTFWIYIWRGIVLSFFLNLIMFVVGFTIAFLFAAFGKSPSSDLFASVNLLILVILSTYFLLRFSPILPAAAIGEKLSLKDAWFATRAYAGSILLAAILYLLIYSAIFWIMTNLHLSNLYVGFTLLSVLGWFYVMWGTSLLTTIFGVAVEKRAV